LDSLNRAELISDVNYEYRVSTLKELMEKHKLINSIKKWLDQNQGLHKTELIDKGHTFDLSKTDSLMRFHFFRAYLNRISQYDLNLITEYNGSSGGFYIDSRVRFDSIVGDKRFNQSAKNFLLFDAFKGIAQNFKVADKKIYFEKLQKNTTNRTELKKLRKEYNIDFTYSNELVLTSIENDKLTYTELLKKNEGKWLYIDFWASWCAPCRQVMPESRKLKKSFENLEVEIIYLSLNDQRENWINAIIKDSIQNAQHYFIENGNTSNVIEELNIETIPHYLIYSPSGELINGYADWPGKGAKEQLEKLISK
jgi:thiol-disulfide isomerase/thioredoxin